MSKSKDFSKMSDDELEEFELAQLHQSRQNTIDCIVYGGRPQHASQDWIDARQELIDRGQINRLYREGR